MSRSTTPLRDQALALAAQCAQVWRDDSDSQAQPPIQVYYAIDVDVINLYCDPHGNAGYAEVFSQFRDLNPRLANVLGDFIVRRGLGVAQRPKQQGHSGEGESVAKPLIVMAPHDRELQRVVAAISRKALSRVASPSLDEGVKRGLEELELACLSGQSLGEAIRLLETVPGLGDFLRPEHGPAEELERLNALPAGCLLPLSQVAALSHLKLPPRRLGEDDVFDERVQRWFDALLKDYGDSRSGSSTWPAPSSQSGSKRDNLRDDAVVLAGLEVLNEALAPSQGAVRGRLCLITGAPRLHRVARQMKQPAHSDFEDFASAYLRHPLAFVGSRGLFEVSPTAPGAGALAQDQELRTSEWLAICFPTLIQQVPHGNAWRISLKHDSDLSATMDLPEAAVQELRDAVVKSDERLQAQRDHERKGQFFAYFKTQVADSNFDADQLWARFWQWRVQSELIQLALKSAPFGLAELLSDPKNRRQGVPALRFDRPDFAEVQQGYEGLSADLFKPRADLTAQQWASLLAEVLERVGETDRSGYHKLVLLGYVHACTDSWQQARSLCRTALMTIDHIADRKSDDKRRGREAAYLLAVAERRLFWPRGNGLKFARQALDEAMRRDEPGSQDVRFESEKLAQEVGQLQLEIYQRSRDFADLSVVAQKDLLGLTQALLKLADVAQVDDDHGVRCWVARQCLTNALVVAIFGYRVPRQPYAQLVGGAVEALERLSKLELAPSLPGEAVGKRRYVDKTSDFLWLIATVIFDRDFGRKRAAADMLISRHDEFVAENTELSSFWMARNKYLFELVQEAASDR